MRSYEVEELLPFPEVDTVRLSASYDTGAPYSRITPPSLSTTFSCPARGLGQRPSGWHYHVTPGKFPYIIGGYFAKVEASNIARRPRPGFGPGPLPGPFPAGGDDQ